MTTNPNAPVSIDYTSRDYTSLREQLIARVSAQIPQWTGTDPSDFGVAMVESLAYVGDVLAYYIDRVANEATLLTATQRQSILNLAEQFGYTPTGYLTAYTNLRFTNSSDTDVTIPSGTQVSGEIRVSDVITQVVFTTLEDVGVPATGEAFITAFHGENVALISGNEAVDEFDVAGELIGVSDGNPMQRFVLSENQVVEGTVRVFVKTGASYEEWVPVTHIANYGPQDNVFYTTLDADNYVYVTFGDGVSGTIPVSTAPIKVQYVVGGGVAGNIPSQTITDIIKVPGLTDAQTSSLASVISVENTSTGVGGADPESDLSIRVAAPTTLAANNRAVTLADYAGLALNVPGVAKSKAEADVWSSVNLYVAPSRNPGDGDLYPLFTFEDPTFTLNTSEWDPLKADVVTELSTKTQVGVTVTVSPPSYVRAAMGITYTLKPQAADTQVRAAILAGLTTAYSYYYSSFGAVITPEEVESIVRSIGGVYNAKVDSLYRLSDTPSRLPLVGAANEIFVFEEGSISLSLGSNNSALTGISPSVGTLSPAFTSAILAYNITGLVSGNTSVTLTFTKSDSASTIYVNGVALAGTTSVQALASGTNVFVVRVLAEDGYTSTTYTITAVK